MKFYIANHKNESFESAKTRIEEMKKKSEERAAAEKAAIANRKEQIKKDPFYGLN